MKFNISVMIINFQFSKVRSSYGGYGMRSELVTRWDYNRNPYWTANFNTNHFELSTSLQLSLRIFFRVRAILVVQVLFGVWWKKLPRIESLGWVFTWKLLAFSFHGFWCGNMNLDAASENFNCQIWVFKRIKMNKTNAKLS